MVLEFMWAKNTIVMPDGEIIFSFNLIAVITHNVRTTSCSRWFQSKEAPRGVGNQHILLSIFHSSGKGFSKQKLAERAISIFKTPSSRGVSPQPKENLKTPGQSRPEFFIKGIPHINHVGNQIDLLSQFYAFRCDHLYEYVNPAFRRKYYIHNGWKSSSPRR